MEHSYRLVLITGLLTGCAGAGPHNSVEPAQSRTIGKIPHNTEKFADNVN